MAAITLSLQQMYELAGKLAKSGQFQGASAESLIARMITGVSLGIDPITACANITHPNGKATFTASLQGALLVNSGRYSMGIRELSDEKCVLEFSSQGKRIGTSTYTIDEAKRAGLTNRDVWKRYPSDLLFARALTRGIRRYCPNLLVGNAALTREEIGEDVREPVVMPKPAAVPSAPAPATTASTNGHITEQQKHDIKALRELLQIPKKAWTQICEKRGVLSAMDLTEEAAAELISSLKTKRDVIEMEEGLAMENGKEIVIDIPTGKKGETGASPKTKS
jgi:hypothetical protein